jgi:hypothetical protein
MAVDDPRDDEPEVGPPDAAADGTPGSTAPLDETREQPRNDMFEPPRNDMFEPPRNDMFEPPLGDTVEQPPADPWAEDTEVRPAGSVPPSFPDSLGEPEPGAAGPAGTGPAGAGPVDVGPTGTGILPTVAGEEPQPRWSARAQVRPPDVDDQGAVDEEWTEPGRSPLVPVLVTVVILLLIGLVVLGAFLLLNNNDDVVTPPSTTPTVQTASAPATSPATRTTTSSAPPTTAPPTEVEIPDLRGQDYDAAAAKLKDLGFVPRRVDEFNGAVPGRQGDGDEPAGGQQGAPRRHHRRHRVQGPAADDHSAEAQRQQPASQQLVRSPPHGDGHQTTERDDQCDQPRDEDPETGLPAGEHRRPAGADELTADGRWLTGVLGAARRRVEPRLAAGRRHPVRADHAGRPDLGGRRRRDRDGRG